MKITTRTNRFEKAFSKKDIKIIKERVNNGLKTFVFVENDVENFVKYWSYSTIGEKIGQENFIVKTAKDIEKIRNLTDERLDYDTEVFVDNKRVFVINSNSRTCEVFNQYVNNLDLKSLMILRKRYFDISFNEYTLGQLLSKRINKIKNKTFFKLADCLA